MGKRGHSEEVILQVLRKAESGDTVVEICRKHVTCPRKSLPVESGVLS